jgi:hypothetical protein
LSAATQSYPKFSHSCIAFAFLFFWGGGYHSHISEFLSLIKHGRWASIIGCVERQPAQEPVPFGTCPGITKIILCLPELWALLAQRPILTSFGLHRHWWHARRISVSPF